MEKLIKIILALLLILCLLDMPYSFYQLVRFVALVGFGYLAVMANKQHNTNAVFIYVALAILFQPFFKIALGRTIWNVVDVIVSISLVISLVAKPKTE
tara:strand:- start:171 stop:464 length:294 start_codon:yes stop_codon:yes gene_type:complete